MNSTTVVEHVQHIAAVRGEGAASKAELEEALRSVGKLQSWVTSSRTALTAALSAHDSFPERTAADCTRGSTRDAIRDRDRAGTLGSAPEFGSLLDEGAITGGHVDALT